MKLSEMKKRMNKFKDFYGGDLIAVDAICKATSKKRLAEVIAAHHKYLELQNIDALTHLENFEKELGL